MIPGPIGRLLEQGARNVRDWVVPPLCLICDALVAEPGGCCASCWSKTRFISRPYCEVLCIPFAIDHGAGTLSPQAIANPPPFDRLRAAILYDRHAGRMVRLLKYSDRQDLAPWMARWMVTAGKELVSAQPCVIPVPLHVSRLRQRRFNQSAELSRHVAGQCGLDHFPEALRRTRRTRQQVGLGAAERQRNVQGAFRVADEHSSSLRGRRVLLVDDVYTSGSTVMAAARALRRAGVAGVDVLTFARVETAGMAGI